MVTLDGRVMMGTVRGGGGGGTERRRRGGDE